VSDDQNEVIKVEIDGKDVIAEVLTGDEEKEYWDNYERSRNSSIDKKNQRKGKGFQGRGKKGKNMWQSMQNIITYIFISLVKSILSIIRR